MIKGIPETTQDLFRLLIERVRSNLHVILCMSPIGDAFRNRIRQVCYREKSKYRTFLITQVSRTRSHQTATLIETSHIVKRSAWACSPRNKHRCWTEFERYLCIRMTLTQEHTRISDAHPVPLSCISCFHAKSANDESVLWLFDCISISSYWTHLILRKSWLKWFWVYLCSVNGNYFFSNFPRCCRRFLFTIQDYYPKTCKHRFVNRKTFTILVLCSALKFAKSVPRLTSVNKMNSL